MDIKTVKEFLTALKSPYAWPGGYPLYFITSDGAALSFETAKKEKRIIASSIRDKSNDGWRVVAVDVNWEDPELYDDHSGERIESAYAEDEVNTNPRRAPFAPLRGAQRHRSTRASPARRNPLAAHAAAIMGNPGRRGKKRPLSHVSRKATNKRIAVQFHAHGVWATVKTFSNTTAGKKAAHEYGLRIAKKIPHTFRAVVI